jgi:hypothetical protein
VNQLRTIPIHGSEAAGASPLWIVVVGETAVLEPRAVESEEIEKISIVVALDGDEALELPEDRVKMLDTVTVWVIVSWVAVGKDSVGNVSVSKVMVA